MNKTVILSMFGLLVMETGFGKGVLNNKFGYTRSPGSSSHTGEVHRPVQGNPLDEDVLQGLIDVVGDRDLMNAIAGRGPVSLHNAVRAERVELIRERPYIGMISMSMHKTMKAKPH